MAGALLADGAWKAACRLKPARARAWHACRANACYCRAAPAFTFCMHLDVQNDSVAPHCTLPSASVLTAHYLAFIASHLI